MTSAPPGAPSPPVPVWQSLSASRRRFVLLAVLVGFALAILFDVIFRLAFLSPSGSITVDDGIGYLPFELAAVAYAALIVASVVLVVRSEGALRAERETVWLGAAWMLASVPLMLDLLVDTAEFKWPVIILFVVVGIRYWKGVRNSHISLMLAPLMVFIAAADGLGHSMGFFCPSTGLDACPVKAVSDVYLVMLVLGLTGLTVVWRNERPKPVPIAVGLLIIVLLLVALSLLP